MTCMVNCSVSVGIRMELDFPRNETRPSLSLGVVLGGPARRPVCGTAEVARGQARLLSFVLREKPISVRQVASRYHRTEIPVDTTGLVTVLGGDPNSDPVWLFQQGGPSTDLRDGHEVKQFANTYEAKTGKRLLLANVHQIQTVDPALMARTDFLAARQVLAEMDLGVEILDRVIRHFKAQKKRVVVFSHSFGSFVPPRYPMLKGPDAADGHVIMAVRPDIEEMIWRNKVSKLHDASDKVHVHGDDGGTIMVHEYSEEERDQYLVDGKCR